MRFDRTPQPWYWVIALLLCAIAGPSRAAEPTTLITKDGRIQLQVPDGYTEKTARKKGIDLEAVNESLGTTILVISESQSKFDSLQAYAESVRQKIAARLRDAQADGGEKIELGGNPAIRYEIAGISRDGLRMASLVTVIQTETRFTQIVGTCLRANFADRKQELAAITSTMKEIPAKPQQ